MKSKGYILIHTLLGMILFLTLLNFKLLQIQHSASLFKLKHDLMKQLYFENKVIKNIKNHLDVESFGIYEEGTCQAKYSIFDYQISVIYDCFLTYQIVYRVNEDNLLVSISVIN